ncbi:Smr/MutS family protein [Malonomonas rubra]|uniref:Smr/MutS family protein n=1 Tax=Malonomonas rubra TaxID=57040 RepID=UPI0026F1DD50|nr:Smr/MutS family protein [Malonomonas rubra]
MAKKKKPAMPKNKEFHSSPFSDLRGFAVSGGQQDEKPKQKPAEKKAEDPVSFAEEMEALGVERLSPCIEKSSELVGLRENSTDIRRAAEQNEEEQFLQAMGELQVKFSDSYAEEGSPPEAAPRRMKQLKKGKLVPEATLDLHGFTRDDVVAKLQFFLQNAQRQGWRTLLVITGRGLNSIDGEPVLRIEAERFLQNEGRQSVAEWARAPKQYGGDGALVLFLRETQR